MKVNLNDLIGKTYNRLTIVSFHSVKKGRTHFLCKCSCGNTTIVNLSKLNYGSTKSCGCIKANSNVRHRLRQSREYMIWAGMKSRCSDVNHSGYKYYGARGVTVCPRWNNFVEFFSDMGTCPTGHTLDRINNDGNYEPGNCRWATLKEQANNKRNNRLLTYNGITKTLPQWCDELKLSRATITNRLFNGWSVERSLTEPIGQSKFCSKRM